MTNSIYKKITVVIPCKNEELYIGKTLRSLSEQIGVENLRVIVADANSTDDTRKIIKKCKKRLDKLKIELIEGGPVSIGRNRGAELVKTPYVLFMDADTELIESDILLSALCKLDDYELITCKIRSSASTFKSKIIFRTFNLIRKYFMTKPFCMGVFFLTSIERFNKLGGFDESVTNSEDYLLSRQYPMAEFHIMNKYVTQDDRRFKYMGYLNFLKIMLMNYINRNNIEYFRKDINYWK
jgi:glycosyltransferase involved in cell wall biosynthesis